MKVFSSWSGGKESALACHKALLAGYDVRFLLNMVTQDGNRSLTHGVSSALIARQSEAIGIPLVQRGTTWGSYEEEFKKAVSSLREKGIAGGIFGDIDIQQHRDWVERVCGELSVEAFEPLWKKERKSLLREFIDSGFRAIVVAVKSELMGEEWLGRYIDDRFVDEMERVGGVDLCGENGEYHTFVVDGPIFKKRVEITGVKKRRQDDHWFLDIEYKNRESHYFL